MNLKDSIQILKNGGVGVLATDTLYGVVGGALFPETVERIYHVRKRSLDKPFIVLIESVNDLEIFGLSPNSEEVKLALAYWHGKVSIILPCDNPKFEYLHRGTKMLAFRIPDKSELLKILKETGPLVAPSANTEGKLSATSINEAKNYFGDEVDFYNDSGCVNSEPSTILKILGNKISVIR